MTNANTTRSNNLLENWSVKTSFKNSEVTRKDIQRSISNLTTSNASNGRKNLTKKDYKEHGKYPLSLLIDAYGSFEAAKIGITDYDKQEIIKDIKNTKKELNDEFNQRSYIEKGKFRLGEIQNKFGSWNKALQKAGINVNRTGRPEGVTRKDIIEDINRVSRNTDGQINSVDYDNKGKYDIKTVYRKFESWKKAKEKTGLEVELTDGHQ